MGKSRAARGLAVAVRGKVAVETKVAVPRVRKWERRSSQIPKRRPAPRPTAQNKKLQNIIEQIWKHVGDERTVGDGTTFDALRNEIRTHQPTAGTDHLKKAIALTNAFNIFLGRKDISEADRVVAENLQRQLNASWEGRRQ